MSTLRPPPLVAVTERGARMRGAATVAAVAAALGWVVALEGRYADLAAAAVVLFALAAAVAHRWGHRLRTAFFVVEFPVLLLAVDVYYSRPRPASALAQNPVDSGGMVKLAAIGLAALIGALACATSNSAAQKVSTPFRIYALYVIAVFFGLRASIDPFLTGYRGLELAAGVLVIAGAYRCYGQQAMVRIERLLYGLIVLLVLSVWFSVVAAPSAALVPTPVSPLPWQIAGVFPNIASNGVGTLGVLLALSSLGALTAPTERDYMPRRYAIFFAALGIVTLVASQYRTGYVEFAAGAALLLLLRGRKTLALVAGLATAGAVIWGAAAATKAQPFLLRGDSTKQAQQLSGRVNMWHSAMPFWHESPWFGRGLLTSTRLEVLPSIGYGDTASIHSTWVETLVGTGLVGTVLLAAALATLFGQTLTAALRPNGRVIPVVLLLSLIVRGVTGNSVETLGFGALLLMVFSLDGPTDGSRTDAR